MEKYIAKIAYDEYKRCVDQFAPDGLQLDEFENLTESRQNIWSMVGSRVLRESNNYDNDWRVIQREKVIEQCENEIKHKKNLVEKIQVDFKKANEELMRQITDLFESVRVKKSLTYNLQDHFNYIYNEEDIYNHDGH